MKSPAKEREVAWLEQGDGRYKEAGGESKSQEQSAKVPETFFLEAHVSPNAAHDDEKISQPRGDGDDLVHMLEIPRSDRFEEPVQPASKE